MTKNKVDDCVYENCAQLLLAKQVIDRDRRINAELEAENERLRKLLGRVEYIPQSDGVGYDHCAWCFQVEWTRPTARASSH